MKMAPKILSCLLRKPHCFQICSAVTKNSKTQYEKEVMMKLK